MRILEDPGFIRRPAECHALSGSDDAVEIDDAVKREARLDEQRRQGDLEQAIYWAQKRAQTRRENHYCVAEQLQESS